jgi:ABC-type amino acid transport substrate-binding protein
MHPQVPGGTLGDRMRARRAGLLALAFAALVLAVLALLRGPEDHPVVTASMLPLPVPEQAPRPIPAATPGVMTYVYNAPESSRDRRYEYHWEILRAALERTSPKYGPYALVPSVGMTEARQTSELMAASGRITVMYLGTTPTLEHALVPVRIPVDKNLGGYNVFLIHRDDAARFARIRTLDELMRVKVGLGLGWIDVDILRSNQFQVVTGSSYEGLFHMAANRRFDGFLRAAVEVEEELEARHAELPELVIEETLLLYYQLPMYFWFSHTPAGEKLAERVRDGMLEMIEDGSYDRIFLRYQGDKIARLKLKSRRLFKIENRYLVPETPFADRRLWFDPMRTP